MLSRKNRLPRSEFSARGFQTTKTPCFSLKAKKNNLSHNRIAVVIGASAEKSAVRRNFWKRHAKRIFLKFPPVGKDFILIFSKRARELKKEEFEDELVRTLDFFLNP